MGSTLTISFIPIFSVVRGTVCDGRGALYCVGADLPGLPEHRLSQGGHPHKIAVPPRSSLMKPASRLPLEGIRVVEFCHVVMGPTCGLVLADMGAEVIKVEPLDGDHTR